ncbi:cytochrome d ubiquinol oxidase subunit II, partial [Clostridium perfringens]
SVSYDTMAIELITAFILGFCVFVPSLILLMRLFLFDANYIRGKSAKKG